MSSPLMTFEGPLDPQSFVGRKDVLNQVFDRLNNPGLLSSSIVGGPRTGKTSILRYIASPQAAEYSQHARRVYVDAEPLGGNASPADFWISVFRAAFKQAPLAALDKALTRAKGGDLDLYDLEDLFDDYAANEQPFVIAIDNFESLLNNTNFWPPKSGFFHDARSLAQRLPRGVAYVTGTMRPLLDLWDPTKIASPYYNVFANILVARMTNEDIVEVVKLAHPHIDGAPSESLVRLVSSASDRHPALVGTVARFLAGRLASGKPADEDSLVELAEDPDGPYVSLIRQIRASLQPLERQLIDSLGEQRITEASRGLLSQLRDYGLLPPGTEF